MSKPLTTIENTQSTRFNPLILKTLIWESYERFYQSLTNHKKEYRGDFSASASAWLLNATTKRSNLKSEHAHHAAGEANPDQLWGDVLPNPNAALSNTLSRCQLHEKQRNSNKQQKKHIQKHEGSWKH